MGKLLIVSAAIILAIAPVCHAGSATSRWDLSVGGMVKVDYLYADQSVNQDMAAAERQASGINTSSRDKYGATSWGVGESRLHFLVNGPETWGAKTSAYIEGDFRSLTSNSVSKPTRDNVEDYGLFSLRHAFMKFEWPAFSLVVGQTWSVPGNQQSFSLLGTHDIGSFNKGILVPQIYGVWQATKTFSVTAGIQSPYSTHNWPGGTLASGPTIDDGFQRSNLPLFFGELLYKTDVLGKIGPWMLQVGVGGVWGQEKPISPPAYGPVGDINSGASFANTVWSGSGPSNSVQYWSYNGYDTSTVNMWMLTFKSYIPLIPEKTPGKLRHSLGLALTAFTGQDISLFAGTSPFKEGTASYDRTGYSFDSHAAGYVAYNTQPFPHANYAAPVSTGGWGQLQWYWTDTLWTGAYYGQSRTSLSNARKDNLYGSGSTQATISTGAIERQQEWHANLVYDPNPTIRLGVEYSWYQTHYARNQYDIATINGIHSGLTSDAKVNTMRFSAQYFF